MARSICFMAFLVLAMMLFVAYEVQAQTFCRQQSATYKGNPCQGRDCLAACLSEQFAGGSCSTPTVCMCNKPGPCVPFQNIPKTNLGEALLEKAETMME